MNIAQTVMGSIVHHFADGLYAKQSAIPADTVIGTHKHVYDHLSILASGRVIVTVEGKPETYSAPACILIRKGIEHLIYAVEDSSWFCIHATSETDPDKVDAQLIEGATCHSD